MLKKVLSNTDLKDFSALFVYIWYPEIGCRYGKIMLYYELRTFRFRNANWM